MGVTLITIGLILLAAGACAWLADWEDNRQRRRRVERLKERRAYLDSLEPKRWTT